MNTFAGGGGGGGGMCIYFKKYGQCNKPKCTFKPCNSNSCILCGDTSHWAVNCPGVGGGGGGGGGGGCFKCGVVGHWVGNCPA